MEFGDRNCKLCRRRPLEAGGNNSCPLPDLHRRFNETLESHDCRAFKLGDAKPSAKRRRRELAESLEPLF